jgi:dihydrofolate reductase
MLFIMKSWPVHWLAKKRRNVILKRNGEEMTIERHEGVNNALESQRKSINGENDDALSAGEENLKCGGSKLYNINMAIIQRK